MTEVVWLVRKVDIGSKGGLLKTVRYSSENVPKPIEKLWDKLDGLKGVRWSTVRL